MLKFRMKWQFHPDLLMVASSNLHQSAGISNVLMLLPLTSHLVRCRWMQQQEAAISLVPVSLMSRWGRLLKTKWSFGFIPNSFFEALSFLITYQVSTTPILMKQSTLQNIKLVNRSISVSPSIMPSVLMAYNSPQHHAKLSMEIMMKKFMTFGIQATIGCVILMTIQLVLKFLRLQWDPVTSSSASNIQVIF